MENSGRLVFKPWERRLDKTECVESDADEELLINIPFTGDVKLKGLIVIGGEDDTHPDKVKDHDDEFNIDMMATHQVRLFKNRENMSFDDAGAKADQEFSLVRDTDGSVQYKTKVGEDTFEFSQILFAGGHFFLSASPDSPLSFQFWGRQHQDILHWAGRGVYTGGDVDVANSLETCIFSYIPLSSSTTIHNCPLNLSQLSYHSQN